LNVNAPLIPPASEVRGMCNCQIKNLQRSESWAPIWAYSLYLPRLYVLPHGAPASRHTSNAPCDAYVQCPVRCSTCTCTCVCVCRDYASTLPSPTHRCCAAQQSRKHVRNVSVENYLNHVTPVTFSSVIWCSHCVVAWRSLDSATPVQVAREGKVIRPVSVVISLSPMVLNRASPNRRKRP